MTDPIVINPSVVRGPEVAALLDCVAPLLSRLESVSPIGLAMRHTIERTYAKRVFEDNLITGLLDAVDESYNAALPLLLAWARKTEERAASAESPPHPPTAAFPDGALRQDARMWALALLAISLSATLCNCLGEERFHAAMSSLAALARQAQAAERPNQEGNES